MESLFQKYRYILAIILLAFAGMGNSQAAENKTLHVKSFKAPELPQGATPNTDKAQPKAIEEESPASRVWKKYKALAAGESLDDEKNKDDTLVKPKAPEKPEAPDAPQSMQDAQRQQTIKQKTGLAAMIEEYKERKKQRSQMRRVTITEPEKN